MTYSWILISGPNVVINSANTLTPSITPTQPGIYKLRLMATDVNGGVGFDEVDANIALSPEENAQVNNDSSDQNVIVEDSNAANEDTAPEDNLPPMGIANKPNEAAQNEVTSKTNTGENEIANNTSKTGMAGSDLSQENNLTNPQQDQQLPIIVAIVAALLVISLGAYFVFIKPKVKK